MADTYSDGPITKIETTDDISGTPTWAEHDTDDFVLDGLGDGNEEEATYQLLGGVTEQSSRTLPVAFPMRNLVGATKTAWDAFVGTRIWVRITRGNAVHTIGGAKGLKIRKLDNLGLTSDGAAVVLYLGSSVAGRGQSNVTTATAA